MMASLSCEFVGLSIVSNHSLTSGVPLYPMYSVKWPESELLVGLKDETAATKVNKIIFPKNENEPQS